MLYTGQIKITGSSMGKLLNFESLDANFQGYRAA